MKCVIFFIAIFAAALIWAACILGGEADDQAEAYRKDHLNGGNQDEEAHTTPAAQR